MNWFKKKGSASKKQKLEPVHFLRPLNTSPLPYKTFKFMSYLKSLFSTKEHYSGLIVRLTLGIVILPHGLQFLFGWLGGSGFNGAMQYLTGYGGLPWIISLLVILLQSFGAVSILIGFAGRIMAFSTTILFIGMIVTSHLDHGFFMNWLGKQSGEGYEYHLLVIGLCINLLYTGSGSFSVDRFLSERVIKIRNNEEFAVI